MSDDDNENYLPVRGECEHFSVKNDLRNSQNCQNYEKTLRAKSASMWGHEW